MTTGAPDEQTFPSTTFEWRQVRIRPGAAGTTQQRRRRSRWHHLARWHRGRKLTLTVSYRGGAEGWWLVEARGSHGVFPASAALEDVMRQVLNEG